MFTVDEQRLSHLPIDVLLQTDGAVRGGAAAQRIGGSAAALTLALSLRLELARLHLLQRLDGHSVHGALWWSRKKDAVSGEKHQHLCCVCDFHKKDPKMSD